MFLFFSVCVTRVNVCIEPTTGTGTSYGHPVRADRPPPSTATRVLHGVRAARGVQHIPAHLEKACDVGPVPGDTLRSIVGCAEADLVNIY